MSKTEKKVDNLDYIRRKTSAFEKGIQENEDASQTLGKYLQNIYLTKELYLKYKKYSNNSAIKQAIQLKTETI